MAGANSSLLQTHLPSPTLSHLFAALDPKSLIISQFPANEEKPNFFQLTTESFEMERGPRYESYARLRESRLRMKTQFREPQPEIILSPVRKQGKFQGTPPSRRKGSSVLAQSVPDFGAAVRKENRRPPPALPPVMESPVKTPASVKGSKLLGMGVKSVNSAEKRSGGAMARKSYATMDEIKGFSINGGERRGGVRGYKNY